MVTNETAGRHVAGGPRITRRRLLAYAAATPTLSVVVKLADAVVGPGGAPPAGAQVAGIVDFTDALTLAAAPTQHLLVVEVTAENRVVARLPRAEVGVVPRTAGVRGAEVGGGGAGQRPDDVQLARGEVRCHVPDDLRVAAGMAQQGLQRRLLALAPAGPAGPVDGAGEGPGPAPFQVHVGHAAMMPP